MADVFRRLILRPPDTPPDRLSQLFQALDEAIHVQNRLAANSPYILRFTGTLQEEPAGFFVEHEPATAWVPRDLFNSAAPPATPDQLLQAAAALFDALAAAHAPSDGRPVVHGGVCPGVMLTDADGLIKITDFGFAPAICKTLGLDAYLNLAVGPYADSTAAWEILTREVVDRDERLCAFIDPDKYGQDTLTSFEPGSDIVASGFILRLLAEHRHPYLHYEPEAHRILDMAQMMSFGVPARLTRKDLRDATDAAIKLWNELVTAMLARVPGERPSAADLTQRLRAVAPQKLDVTVLKAQRWVTQLESMLEAKAWAELNLALKGRPALESWPPELAARAADVERRVAEYVSEAGRRAAAEAELQAAQKWFDRVQSAARAENWTAAQELLDARPQIDHWPEHVLRELDPVAERVRQAQAAQKARTWLKALQKAYDLKDWSALGRRFAQRPAPEDCPPDVQQPLAAIEAEYKRHLDEEERRRQRVAADHAEVHAWLAEVQRLTSEGKWGPALDALAAKPHVKHWPEGVQSEVKRLTDTCRQHSADSVVANLDTITESVRRQTETVAHATVAEKLAGLLRPELLEAAVEYVMWAPPGTDADGRAAVTVHMRSQSASLDGGIPATELDFRLHGGTDVKFCGGLDELRKRVAEGLTQQLTSLQAAQLHACETALRQSVFSEAVVKAQLAGLQREVPAEIRLVSADAVAKAVQATLRWDDSKLCWAPADAGALARRALEIAHAVCQAAARAALLAKSAALRACEDCLKIELSGPAETTSELPKSLAFELRVAVDPGKRGQLQSLGAGSVRCAQISDPALDLDIEALESKFAQLVVAAQNESRAALDSELTSMARAAKPRARIVTPKRSRVPIDEMLFEVKPKGVEPLSLPAVWNPATWTYEFPTGWQQKVQAALTPPPEPAGTPGESRTGKPASGRRGMVAGAGVLVLVLAAVGLYFAFSGPKPTPTPQPPPAEPPIVKVPEKPPVEATGPTGEQTPQKPPEEVVEKPPEPPAEKPAEVQVEKPAEQPSEVVVEPPPVAPPPVDLVQALRTAWQPRVDLGNPQSVALEALFDELIPAADRAAGSAGQTQLQLLSRLAQPQVAISDLQAAPNDRVSMTITLTLKANAGVQAQTFTMRLMQDQWSPDAGNAATLTNLAAAAQQAALKVVVAAREQCATAGAAGNLKVLYGAVAGVDAVLEPLATEHEVELLRDLLKRVPPSWEQKQPELAAAGYRLEGEPDPATGYPPRLVDQQGNQLLLVSVSPADDLWKQLPALKADAPLSAAAKLTAAERPWELVYIDAAEVPAGGFTRGAQLAADRRRRVPTRDEWFLAALKLRTDAAATGFVGGLWEWCRDPGQPPDGPHWLCGGSKLLTDRTLEKLPLPQPADGLDKWYSWLTNPLVMQRRAAAFGDDLTGVRTLLRIHPPD